MTKTTKQPSQKLVKKTLLKEINSKLEEAVKGYHKKIGEKKFEKQIRKAGKMLSKFLIKEQITIVHKEKIKAPKKLKKETEKEIAS